jgi:hypothetical protein
MDYPFIVLSLFTSFLTLDTISDSAAILAFSQTETYQYDNPGTQMVHGCPNTIICHPLSYLGDGEVTLQDFANLEAVASK